MKNQIELKTWPSGNKAIVNSDGTLASIDKHLMDLWINHKAKFNYPDNAKCYKLNFEYFLFNNYSSLFDLIYSDGERNFKKLLAH